LHDVARAAGHRWPIAKLTTGVVEFISAMPVYRTDVAPRAAIQPADRAVIEQTSHDASPPDTPNTIAEFVADVLLGAAHAAESTQSSRSRNGCSK
jgi:maltooligosyltrehalose synthase